MPVPTLFELALKIQSEGVEEAKRALAGIEANLSKIGTASKAQQKEITANTRLLSQLAAVTNKADKEAIAGLQLLTQKHREWAVSLGATAEQLVRITAVENRLNATHQEGFKGVGRLTNSFESLASHLVGIHPIVGKVSTTLAEFGVGSVLTLGVVAGVAAIAFAYEKLTSSAREAKKEVDDLIESLNKQAKAEHAGTTQGRRETFLLLQQAQADAKAALQRFEDTGGEGPAGLGSALHQRLQKELAAADVAVREAAADLKKSKRDALEAEQDAWGAWRKGLTDQIERNKAAYDKLTAAEKAAWNKREQQLADSLKELNRIWAQNFGAGASFAIDLRGSTADILENAIPFLRDNKPENSVERDMREHLYEVARKAAEAAADAAEAAAKAAKKEADRMQAQLADIFSSAFINGITQGFQGGGIGGAFKQLTATILQGFGSMLVEIGKKAIAASAIMKALASALSKLNPFVALAAGIAFVALGNSMGGRGGSGGGGFGGGLGGDIGRGTEEVTRLKFINRDGSGVDVTPRPFYNVTIIGANDPAVNRQFAQMLENHARR